MTSEEMDALAQVVAELRQLRQSVDRIGDLLLKEPKRRAGTPKPLLPPLIREECRSLYREIVDEYLNDKSTGKLDTLVSRPRSDVEMFCAENNLPIDVRLGKNGIRGQILARVREEEQLRAVHPMHRNSRA
jgi:hypothetical protein